jgi:hypothetical protein
MANVRVIRGNSKHRAFGSFVADDFGALKRGIQEIIGGQILVKNNLIDSDSENSHSTDFLRHRRDHTLEEG